MKAIIADKEGKLHLENVNVPAIKQDELLIKIVASGFNPIDYQMLENELERKLMHSPILGREFSGIVVEVGEKVKDFKVGDAVFSSSGSMGSNGTYAEYIAVQEAVVVHKPTFLSFEQAAGIPSVGLTALQSFSRMKLQNTDSVLITGAAGGVGAMLIKILLANKFSNFIVTAGNEESIQALIEIGVKHNQIVNYKTDDVETFALAKNNQQKFDFVVDLVGNEIGETAARLLKTNGTFLDVTALYTKDLREILFNKGAVIMNISNYAYSADKNYGYYKNGLLELVRLIENELVTPPNIEIMGQLNTETVIKAHERLRLNKTKGKKLIMQVNTI
ncbi:NADP-dependent oxidoreductase [Flavobacterium sp. LS1R47]|uniref:NADP-dependent oxidoreductase n=1 Tax=Flavobacterium frigoritolerans TaxID=2987686 RepID=A0A9X3C992_9FLAO|nr:NADP-dependent oxidoreductase [Flavobacterium frigoritolerans]MCV9933927.1 NADP-dependent oxidoreductase [Flavobacterium frigoritolerans]